MAGEIERTPQGTGDGAPTADIARQGKRGDEPLADKPGEDAQADRGEVEVIMAGGRDTVDCWAVRLCYSMLASRSPSSTSD